MAMLPPTLPLAPLPERLALIPFSTLTDLKVRGVTSFSAAMCPSAEGHSPAPAKLAPSLFPVQTCLTLEAGPCQPVYPATPALHCLGTMFFSLRAAFFTVGSFFLCNCWIVV